MSERRQVYCANKNDVKREGFIHDKHFIENESNPTLYFKIAVERPYSDKKDYLKCVAYGEVAKYVDLIPNKTPVLLQGYTTSYKKEIAGQNYTFERMNVKKASPILTKEIMKMIDSSNFVGISYDDINTLNGEEVTHES